MQTSYLAYKAKIKFAANHLEQNMELFSQSTLQMAVVYPFSKSLKLHHPYTTRSIPEQHGDLGVQTLPQLKIHINL